MYIGVSRLRVFTDRAPELIEAFTERTCLVDRYDGFVDREVWQSDHDPGQILMVSRWLDRDRFKADMKSEDHRTSHRRIAPDLKRTINLDSLEHMHTYEVVAE